VIGCDTIAECRGEVLGKPSDLTDARRMLRLLRGCEHRVISGVCIWNRPSDSIETATDVTRLTMDDVSESAIEAYLATGGWQGKAGAFGYQDGLDWIHIVEGSESNVVGLPMELLQRLLRTNHQWQVGKQGS
jgi:septum formation protein